MISVGGNSFRTLKQPIFVNGKRVRQVWVDDQMVYPEISYPSSSSTGSTIYDCNLIKVRGKIHISCGTENTRMTLILPSCMGPVPAPILSGLLSVRLCIR